MTLLGGVVDVGTGQVLELLEPILSQLPPLAVPLQLAHVRLSASSQEMVGGAGPHPRGHMTRIVVRATSETVGRVSSRWRRPRRPSRRSGATRVRQSYSNPELYPTFTPPRAVDL